MGVAIELDNFFVAGFGGEGSSVDPPLVDPTSLSIVGGGGHLCALWCVWYSSFFVAFVDVVG